MLDIKGIRDIIKSYIYELYKNEDASINKIVKTLNNNYEGNYEIYVDILRLEKLHYKNHPQIMDENETVKALYWGKPDSAFEISKDKETLKWIMSEFKRYKNKICYIKYLHSNLKVFTLEEILEYMTDFRKNGYFQLSDQMEGYYLRNICIYIEKGFDGQHYKYNEIMLLEIYLSDIVKWSDMKCTQYILKRNPEFYAQLIDIIYSHEDQDKGTEAKGTENILKKVLEFYNKAFFCPCENNGDVNLNELKNWVSNFKNRLSQQKQLKLLGHVLGRLFAYSPVGSDGYYPHESVRELIEEISDDSLIKSYVTSEFNKRGMHNIDSGKGEKELALQYKENANAIRILYSESAKIFDKLYDDYFHDSEVVRRMAEDGWQ